MTWSEIVIHHSASPDHPEADAPAIKEWHTKGRGWRDIGYHVVVELVGDHYLGIFGRPLSMPGAHAPGHNRTAIGVCLVGNFTEEPPPPRQLECASAVVGGLAVAFGIPLEAVLPHRDVRSTACPGDAFPWAAFIERVERHL